MAVFGGIILILTCALIIWVSLMGRFEKIGDKVSDKIEKTFKEEKGKNNE